MGKNTRPPHTQRNILQRMQQLRQSSFIRSTTHLRSQIARGELQPMGGAALRQLKPRGNLTLEQVAPKSIALHRMIEHIAELGFERTGQDSILKTRRSVKLVDEVAKSVSIRDVDGNVIHVDDQDRPYVVVSDGQIVYVRVCKTRIDPKGRKLDAQCTVENPDGLEEVLLVEPMPALVSGG